MTRNSYRIPTLDGWRGIAIILVIWDHFQRSFFGDVYHQIPWLGAGKHGVTIFFVLSGYLITSLLLTEDKINLRAFYVRRFFRLMPCAWTYLITVAVVGVLVNQKLIGIDALAALLCVRNYFGAYHSGAFYMNPAFTAHFWSLSIEEQFYMAWPAVLLIAGRKRALWLALAAIAGVATFRFYNWQAYSTLEFGVRTEVRIDALLVGCVAALLLQFVPLREWLRARSQLMFWSATPVAAWCMYRYHTLIPLQESVAFAMLMVATSLNPTTLVARILEWKHLKIVGTISYSLYIWQEIFLQPNWIQLGACLLPLAALVSYILIERPFIKIGHRLSTPSTSEVQTGSDTVSCT